MMGGEFGVERTFDDNTYFQSGFVISVNISVNDNALFAAQTIAPGDHLFFIFSDS